MTADLPSGTVTFLFTDIEGSTRLLRELGDRYEQVRAEHDGLLRAAVVAHGGEEVDTQGDSFFFSFRRAGDAVAAAADAQRALAAHPWPGVAAVRVRMGLHTGEPTLGKDGRYVGLSVHRAARIGAAARGGEALLSSTTADLVSDRLPEGLVLRDRGRHRLKDFDRPEQLFQLVGEGLPSEFPPVRTTSDRRRRRRVLAASIGVVVTAGIAVSVAVVTTGGSRTPRPVTVLTNSVARINANTSRVVGDVATGVGPAGVAAGDEGVWVANAVDGTVQRIAPGSMRVVRTLATPPRATGLALGFGYAWASASHGRTLYRIDPRENNVTATVPLRCSRAAGAFFALCEGAALATGAGSVWGLNDDGTLTRIAPIRAVVVERGIVSGVSETGGAGGSIAAGKGAVWTATSAQPAGEARLVRVDLLAGAPTQSVPLPGVPRGLALGSGSVWVTAGDQLLRVDPGDLTVDASIPLDGAAAGVAVGAGAVWVAGGRTGVVWKIDPQANRVLDTIRLTGTVAGVAVWHGTVWVTIAD